MKIKVKCEHCGKEFYRHEAQCVANSHHYCCKKCFYEHRRILTKLKNAGEIITPNRIIAKCDYCGQTYITYKNVYDISQYHFCSKLCGTRSLKKEERKLIDERKRENGKVCI